MCKRRPRGQRRHTDIAGAEKKLRQAWFFLGYLELTSKEMAGPDRDPERLEFYFSACLSAAQSVYYVLEEAGGATFREIQTRWRDQLPEPQRSRFPRMIGLRGDDVHLASPGAEPLPKYVPADPRHYRILGPSPLIEMENPDGAKVSGDVLVGAVGLYIKQQGQRTEATTACREFLEQLTSLLEEVKATSGGSEAGGSQL